MSNSLEQYSWVTGKTARIPGTEDWVEVAELADSGGGYDWTIFNVYYSPSARLYFWHGDSGCSCNAWEDGVSSAADFENGDRDALARSWDRFADGHYLSDADRADGRSRIAQLSTRGVSGE